MMFMKKMLLQHVRHPPYVTLDLHLPDLCEIWGNKSCYQMCVLPFFVLFSLDETITIKENIEMLLYRTAGFNWGALYRNR